MLLVRFSYPDSYSSCKILLLANVKALYRPSYYSYMKVCLNLLAIARMIRLSNLSYLLHASSCSVQCNLSYQLSKVVKSLHFTLISQISLIL